MALSATRVIGEYKANAGITVTVPKLEILVQAIFNEIKENGVVTGTITGDCQYSGSPLADVTMNNGKML